MYYHSKTMELPEEVYKIVIVGDMGVGSSSIIKRYVNGTFNTTYNATIGIGFWPKNIKLDNITTRLEFWDVSGQERYGTMLKTYYKDASGIILICDVSRDTTIESIPKWNKTIMKFCPEDIPRILLINKVDLVDDTYDYSHFNDLCDKNEIIAWFKTSAKDNIGINQAFEKIHLLARGFESKSMIEIPIVKNDTSIFSQLYTQSNTFWQNTLQTIKPHYDPIVEQSDIFFQSLTSKVTDFQKQYNLLPNQHQKIYDICDILQDFTLTPENRLTKLRMCIIKSTFSDNTDDKHIIQIKELILEHNSQEAIVILNKIAEYLTEHCK